MVEASKVHLIGIGGTGLSAIARVLMESGYRVTGSDQQLSPLAIGLRNEGLPVYIGHRAENIGDADLVVMSSAVPESNVEVQAARKKNVPVMKRSEFLGELMVDKFVIAIAGTHGKTTTTAMIAWVLANLEQDPSYIIGGVSIDLKTNAHAGSGKYFVIEADEYDRMFLGLRPDIAVITNVEHDHPDYFPEYDDLFEAFVEFLGCVRSGGMIILNGDDEGARKLISEAAKKGLKHLTFGIGNPDQDYTAQNIVTNSLGGFSCDIVENASGMTKDLPGIQLRIPGRHNILNALAIVAVAQQLGLPLEKVALALRDFNGTGRRFEVRGEAAGILVIDDYAHHPTEIKAVLSAARLRYAGKRIWAVWQPHTYSRTRVLAHEFSHAFQDADQVIVTEIFPSRESQPADGYSASQVVSMMDHPRVNFIAGLPDVTRFLLANLKRDDVLLVLSAGDADQISTHVLTALVEREHSHA